MATTKSFEQQKAKLARYGYRLRKRGNDGAFDIIDLRANTMTAFVASGGMREVAKWFAAEHPKRSRRAA